MPYLLFIVKQSVRLSNFTNSLFPSLISLDQTDFHRVAITTILLLEFPLTGDREPIIVNISHESESVRNFEAAIWQ